MEYLPSIVMPNPSPKTGHLKPHQFEAEGDEPLGKKTWGVRFPASVEAAILELPQQERYQFIRIAVLEKLKSLDRL